MIKTLTKHGNSQALILDRAILELMEVSEGSKVSLRLGGRRLVVEPVDDWAALAAVPDLIAGIADRHRQAFVNLAK